MRRRKFDATSGLDLFLDAICNTFGGIVFISMLVVILINSTSITSCKDEEKDSQQMQDSFEELKQEKINLLEEVRQHEDATKILGDPSEIPELLANTKVARVTAARLQDELSKLTQQFNKSKTEVDQISKKEEQHSAKEKELESLTKQLQREIAKRTKQLTLPTETDTTLIEQPFFLKERRLVECKEENIERETDGIMPKPGAGIHVSKPSMPSIQAEFARYNPRAHYIALVLWEDSFAQWPTVQAAIRRKGLSYRLLLRRENEKVTTGGSSGKVQK